MAQVQQQFYFSAKAHLKYCYAETVSKILFVVWEYKYRRWNQKQLLFLFSVITFHCNNYHQMDFNEEQKYAWYSFLI